MFDLDKWQEILDTLRKNKLRSLLTGFSVAWGIFMLIILLGSGQGLSAGVQYQFRDDAVNSVWMWPGETSVPHKGLQPGREVQFTNEDFGEIQRTFEQVDHITARFAIGATLRVNYKNESGSFDIRCVHPDHRYLEKTIMTSGRFLNDRDLAEHRKVAVVGELVAETLFVDEPPIGKYLSVNGVPFKVVGVFKDEGGESEMEKIYLPITTAQRAFNGANRVNAILMTLGDATVPESEEVVERLRGRMADRHDFAMDDERAIFIRNGVEAFEQVLGVMNGIRLFVWIIGIGTILAGVVGVSNMMIAVKERTREIGIRKAVGATPWSVVALVLQESILVTAVAGYLGLVAGVALLESLARFLPAAEFFRDPHVDLGVAVKATILLIVAGSIAGFFPARRAAAIRPIEALREE